MEKIINVSEITILHREAIIAWKASEIGLDASNASAFLGLVEQNHAFNYRLWHAEDKARRDDMGHAFVYEAKREIDGHNQKRNDCMEAMDDYLIGLLKPAAPDLCVVHSETPGMMIDRLSILALKQYHMTEQTVRQDVDDMHRAQCLEKRNIIDAQIIQLSNCLSDLLQEVLQKKRTFRVYRQFKMYNSAQLNPELYAQEQ